MLALEEASMKEATDGGDDAMVVAARDSDEISDNRPHSQGSGKSNKHRNNKNRNNKQNGGGGQTTGGGLGGAGRGGY
ncbi:hypothetical protein OROMI_001818 [Orobanche minor]